MCLVVRTRVLIAAIFALMLAVPPSASAKWRADWELTYLLLFSDNVGRDPANEQDDFVHAPQVGLSLVEDTGRLTGQVDLLVERRIFQDSTFDDEDRNYLDLELRLRILDNRLDWVLQDELREEPISVRAVRRPNNFQEVNYFTTGPDFTFQLGRGNNAILQARFVDSYAEVQDQFDAQHLEGGLIIERELSENTLVALGSSFADVDFDRDDLNNDYIQRSYFGRWQNVRRRDEFRADLGWTEADFRGGTALDVDDVLFDAGWTRRDNRYALGVNLFHGLTTLARTIGDEPLAEGGDVINGRVTESDSIDVFFEYTPNIGSWQVRGGYSEDNFVGDDLFDRKQFELDVRYSRPLSRRSTADIYARRTNVEFTADILPRDDDRTELGFSYQYEWSAHWFGGFLVQWTDQNSDFQQFTYEEMLAGIRISYRRNPPDLQEAR